MLLCQSHGRHAVRTTATSIAATLATAFSGAALADFNDAVVVRYALEAEEADGTMVSVMVEDLYLLTDDPKDVDLNIYDLILPADGRVPYFQSQTGPGWTPTNIGGPFDTSALRFADSFVTVGGMDFGTTAPPQSPGAGGATQIDPFFGGNDVAYPIDRAGWFNSSPPNLQGIAGQTPAGLGVMIGRFAYDGEFSIVGATLSATWNQGIGTTGTQASFVVREFVDCNGNIVEDAVEVADASIAPSPNAFRWEVADGGNGHWYELVDAAPATLEDAALAAAARGGYLATFAEAGESDFVASMATLKSKNPSQLLGAYVGGTQRQPAIEPLGSWGWATGEAWSDVNWRTGEPNDFAYFGGSANGIEIYLSAIANGTFNDTSGVDAKPYLIEWDAAADCNNNGELDTCDIASGLESDLNGNRIPDSCEAILVPGDAPTIQAAIDGALDGDLILVSPGTYVENLVFPTDGRDIVLVSTDGAATTIIDGDTESRATIEITGGQTQRSRIDGFTVTGGRTGSFAPVDNPAFLAGGGVYAEWSSPAFNDCIFVGNRSTFGGNFYGRSYDGEIRDCQFLDGFSLSDGGGLQLFECTALVATTTFSGNTAVNDGGALKAVRGASSVLDCSMTSNDANTGGGVMYFESDGVESSFDFLRCEVSGNLAKFGGGFWSRPTGQGPSVADSTVCENLPDNFFGPYIDLDGNDFCACVGDLNFDGVVNGEDLGLWLLEVGTDCPANGFCPADLDGDGEITGGDLGLVLVAWGACS